jgi:glutamine amidotransferase-like uncharacterized protein
MAECDFDGKGKLMKYLIDWLLIPLLILLMSNCSSTQAADVAVYSDNGTREESVLAGEKMFEWMGYAVSLVNADYINDNGLDKFKILYIPGGDMYQYATDLSSQGKKNIKDFIREGGAYIGICGGAFFAAKKVIWRGQQLSMVSLELFSGTAEGPIDEIIPYPEYGMCQVNIVDTVHPITESGPDSMWILYYWGPALNVENDASAVILGTYNIGNLPVMLAINYGLGRVFLIGTHPEIEEDSDRDGVEFGDEFDDHGSDWDLIKKAVLWCLRE